MVRACVDPMWHSGETSQRFTLSTPVLLQQLAGIKIKSQFCLADADVHTIWRPINECGVSAIAELSARQDELICKIKRLRRLNRAQRSRAFDASVAQVIRWPFVALQGYGLKPDAVHFNVNEDGDRGQRCFKVCCFACVGAAYIFF